MLGQLKTDGSPGLSLTYHCSVDCVTIGSNILDLDGDHAVLRCKCLLMTDTVEKVVSDPPKRNNRIRTARYLNRNCVRGRDFESMLRIQGRKIVFQQYRPKADIRCRRSMSACG